MIMKKTAPLIISLFLLISFSPALAEIKNFIKQYTDQVSEDDNKDSSRTIALREVKRLLLKDSRLPSQAITDHNLPQYDGTLALAEAKKQCPGVPFILVTDAISENLAIETLTNGAKDYVMKSRLAKIPVAFLCYVVLFGQPLFFLFSNEKDTAVRVEKNGDVEGGAYPVRKL